MSSRERILNALRSSQKISASATASSTSAAMPELLSQSGSEMQPEALSEAVSEPGFDTLAPSQWRQTFIQNLQDNHAEVIEVTASQLADQLAQLLQHHKLGRCLIGSSDSGVALARQLPQLEVLERELSNDEWFRQVDAGVSFAAFGLAATGSLVLITGPQEPRRLSLVPPLHIVIIQQSRLLADFNQLVADDDWQTLFGRDGGDERADSAPATNVLLISGPSKTADIQQTLAYGAHGPKQLCVLLVTDEGDHHG